MIYRDSEALALKEPGGRQTHDPKGAGSLISALRGMCGGGGVGWAGEWRVRRDFIQKGADTQQTPAKRDGAELGGRRQIMKGN